MTGTGVRASMTMRATVSRNLSGSKTDWGRKGVPDFFEVGVIPCRAFSKSRRDVDTDRKSGVVGDLRALVPVDVDVKEEDQLEIRDRLGNLLFGGPVLVETAPHVGGYGSGSNHNVLNLRRHTSAA